MAKIEIDMELGKFEGFKVRIRADREDLPGINKALSKQLMGALMPATEFFEDPARKQISSAVVPTANEGNGGGGGRGKNGRRSKPSSNGNVVQPIQWQHDSTKWGMPSPKWKAGQKMMWLSYVIKNEGGDAEQSAAVLAETFSAKFKQFGAPKRTSMPSILAALKTSQPALMLDDTGKDPITWFLTPDGDRAAEALVVEARTPSTASTMGA
jgi:hypothetical protein